MAWLEIYLFIRLKYSPLFQAGLMERLKSFKALNSLVKIATHRNDSIIKEFLGPP